VAEASTWLHHRNFEPDCVFVVDFLVRQESCE
jgi:hypothetical protein